MFVNFLLAKDNAVISFQRSGENIRYKKVGRRYSITDQFNANDFEKFVVDHMRKGYKARF
jgi:hypothetical protein